MQIGLSRDLWHFWIISLTSSSCDAFAYLCRDSKFLNQNKIFARKRRIELYYETMSYLPVCEKQNAMSWKWIVRSLVCYDFSLVEEIRHCFVIKFNLPRQRNSRNNTKTLKKWAPWSVKRSTATSRPRWSARRAWRSASSRFSAARSASRVIGNITKFFMLSREDRTLVLVAWTFTLTTTTPVSFAHGHKHRNEQSRQTSDVQTMPQIRKGSLCAKKNLEVP